MDDERVKNHFGVAPALVPHVQALSGDPSDNIPGIPGIGPKTAAKLMTDFNSLDDLIDSIESGQPLPPQYRRFTQALQADAERLPQYLQMCTLVDDIPLTDDDEDVTLEQMRWGVHPEPQVLIDFLDEQGFVSIWKHDYELLSLGNGHDATESGAQAIG